MIKGLYKAIGFLSVLITFNTGAACPSDEVKSDEIQTERLTFKLVEKGIYDINNAKLYVETLSPQDRADLYNAMMKTNVNPSAAASMIIK